MEQHQKIIILDFGAQYSQLIARRVRELGVYSELHPFDKAIDLSAPEIKGIILSGGPSSVLDHDSPDIDAAIFDLGKPVLGICYGMQLMAKKLGGKLSAHAEGGYGHSAIHAKTSHVLLDTWFGGDGARKVWMSHGDRVESLPEHFSCLASSEDAPIAAIAHQHLPLIGIQFHPEVSHTEEGATLLKNFLNLCKCDFDWSMGSFIDTALEAIKQQVGDGAVIGAVSGGVDSTVMAALCHKALGDRFHAVFVDNGLLRAGERDYVERELKQHLGINLHVLDARQQFLTALSGIEDPELKRKCIGRVFIEGFEAFTKDLTGVTHLAQGTLFPDVIESVSHRGPSVTIKSHHNVGGLPASMNLKLLEPFRELFKDEVRRLGTELGITESLVQRQPFPGPGLAVRTLGPITEEKLHILRAADHIVTQEIEAVPEVCSTLWQYFAVLLPVHSVGVMGDQRTYDQAIAVRAVSSADGMTADWAELPHSLLKRIATRIVNEVNGINRIVYDITSKPPGTIEWE